MGSGNVLTQWTWGPSVIAGCILILLLYFSISIRKGKDKGHSRDKPFFFSLGVLAIFLALTSPIDAVGDGYLFSAHMLQHTILAMTAPPLLLAGIPDWMLKPIFSIPLVNKGWRFLTRPLIAFLLFNLIFLGWHFPGFFELSLENETSHIIEHLLFIITGILNWWPILSPTDSMPGLKYPGQVLYLFLDGMPSTVLGMMIVFSQRVLYPTYAAAPRMLGLSAIDDQQIAGLIMAVPAGIIFFGALTLVFFKWMESENQHPVRSTRRPQ